VLPSYQLTTEKSVPNLEQPLPVSTKLDSMRADSVVEDWRSPRYPMASHSRSPTGTGTNGLIAAGNYIREKQ